MGEAKRRKKLDSNYGKPKSVVHKQNEHPNIAFRDWRLHAISTVLEDTKLPNNKVVASGTAIELAGFAQLGNEVICFPVPNPVALYISLARTAGRDGKAAYQILKESPKSETLTFKKLSLDNESAFFDSIEKLVACVIFSFSALEVFANISLPDDFIYRKLRPDKKCIEEFSRDQIERHLSLREKLDALLPDIFDVASPKGTALWEEFIRLQRLRDGFVHLKTSDWRNISTLEASETIWTRLLSPDTPEIYKTSINMIDHFCKSPQLQRWFLKVKKDID
jgi:hypothetical protein